MWIYSTDSTGDTEAVNMNHVVSIRLVGGVDGVLVVATDINGDVITIKECNSGGEARDWLKHLMAGINDRP